MKLCKKITGGIARIAEIICMFTIAAMVIAIVVELFRRNFLNQSFTGNVQLCGILFLWMAFTGLIPLYHNSGLMRLDFLVTNTKGRVYEVLYFLNKIVSLMLGIVMIIAFCYQYPYVSTRTYQSFPIKVPYTIQYIPMAIAGAYMVVKTVEQLAERIMILTGRLPEDEKGGTRA